jgi:hypothetical protein
MNNWNNSFYDLPPEDEYYWQAPVRGLQSLNQFMGPPAKPTTYMMPQRKPQDQQQQQGGMSPMQGYQMYSKFAGMGAGGPVSAGAAGTMGATTTSAVPATAPGAASSFGLGGTGAGGAGAGALGSAAAIAAPLAAFYAAPAFLNPNVHSTQDRMDILKSGGGFGEMYRTMKNWPLFSGHMYNQGWKDFTDSLKSAFHFGGG